MPAELVDAVKRRERIAELLAELDAENGTRDRVNTTDVESRVMHAADGTNVQGFNAQVVCGEGQVVLAAAVCNEANDSHRLVPMFDELGDSLAAAGVTSDLGVVLADVGYFTAENMAGVEDREIDALDPREVSCEW